MSEAKANPLDRREMEEVLVQTMDAREQEVKALEEGKFSKAKEEDGKASMGSAIVEDYGAHEVEYVLGQMDDEEARRRVEKKRERELPHTRRRRSARRGSRRAFRPERWRRRARRLNPAPEVSLVPIRPLRRRKPGPGTREEGARDVVIGFRIPVSGRMGKILDGALQGATGGAVVLGSWAIAAEVVTPLDSKMRRADGSPWLGKLQKPLLFGAAAGISGALARYGAKLAKGDETIWTILGAAGPGLAAVASLFGIFASKDKPPAAGSAMARLLQVTSALADYVQTEDYREAGVGEDADDEAATVDGADGDEDADQLEDAWREAGVGADDDDI